ncbi:MAG: hydrolase [Planctomycetaceae bacterium]
MPYLRSPELISRRAARLLIVDVQEKLVPAIPVREKLIRNCRRLIEAARLFDVPVAATEQYPRGLGGTVRELAELIDEIPDKARFSCAEVLNWGPAAEQREDRWQVIVAGMEAHVCVLQTVLDLLSLGYRVFVVADAVASRGKLDWRIALERMAASGAIITTTESVLFEWCEVSGTPEFKEVSRLVKEG